MHEFALAESVFQTCLKTAQHYNAKKIVEINIELGDFSLTVEDLLINSFKILAKDSIAADAKLIIKRTPGILKCLDCGKTSEIWFSEEKNKESDNEHLGDLEEFETMVHGASGYHLLGINLFKCKYCGSRNTELTGGREFKLKNIKIEE
ncbi:MAG: hydrogenase maturation nickel metallochaperone HypA/HybF [Promethearchaeota archaeon]